MGSTCQCCGVNTPPPLMSRNVPTRRLNSPLAPPPVPFPAISLTLQSPLGGPFSVCKPETERGAGLWSECRVSERGEVMWKVTPLQPPPCPCPQHHGHRSLGGGRSGLPIPGCVMC